MDNYKNYKLIAVSLGLLYCFYYVTTRLEWHFIDSVDLIIHEAGHVIFMFFGQTLYVAGGSLLQILIPLVFAGYFLYRQAYYSATAMFYWTGLSIVNVSVYAGDALRMQLPLLTGDTDGHDWNQLLFQFGLLSQTHLIATIILLVGVLCILAGFFLVLYNWKD